MDIGKRGSLLFKASTPQQKKCVFSFWLCVFFPLDHITRWFASSVQVITGSGEWNANAFKLVFCCGEVNAPTLRHKLCRYKETHSMALTFRHLQYQLERQAHKYTFHYEIKTTSETHLSPPAFFFAFPLSCPPVKEWTNVTLINIDKLFHEMSSGMEKWTRPWREIESRVESETECKCFDDQGRYLEGEGQKTDIMHLYSSLISSVITLFFPLFVSLRLHLIGCYPSITLSRSFSTVESPKWQHIKHLGTEAPWALINTSLALKMIISRREWVLDGWRSSTNEIKISFLTKVSFYCAISEITKDLNPFTLIFLWHSTELNPFHSPDALMDIIINLLFSSRFFSHPQHLQGLFSA